MRIRGEAILFDLDGVLVDSGEAIEQSWREWAARHDIDPGSILRQMHGCRSEDTIASVAPHLDADAEARALLEIELNIVHLCRPYAGALAMLDALIGRPHAVVTSGETSLATARLRQCRLPIPAVLVTADQLTAGKPDPEGYLLAAQRLGKTPGRCVVIEDSAAGLQAAKAAGMAVVGVATTHSAASLAGADAVVESLDRINLAFGGDHIELTTSEDFG